LLRFVLRGAGADPPGERRGDDDAEESEALPPLGKRPRAEILPDRRPRPAGGRGTGGDFRGGSSLAGPAAGRGGGGDIRRLGFDGLSLGLMDRKRTAVAVKDAFGWMGRAVRWVGVEFGVWQ